MQDAVQALDVALKHSVSLRDDTQVFARAIFWRDDTKVRSLGGGAEVGRSWGCPCRACARLCCMQTPTSSQKLSLLATS